MKYLGEYNNPLHLFPSYTRVWKKKSKDKDKDLQDNNHAIYTIWSRNLELQLKTNLQAKWNSTQITQDNFLQKLARQNLTY